MGISPSWDSKSRGEEIAAASASALSLPLSRTASSERRRCSPTSGRRRSTRRPRQTAGSLGKGLFSANNQGWTVLHGKLNSNLALVPDRGGLQANIKVPFFKRSSLYASEEVLVRRVERLGELVQLRNEVKS